ncbi:hypothetical protein C8024_12000 [Sphingopyxis sp. BSNA05]|uniref:sulfotransferase family protein n=1 Tax=Sphingopyxis sp. BSNA05 TaxID=1236614 RepID=UPI001D69F04F|nr:hypothetical protein [Sphingopyxis sp. BSNA05]
MVPIGVNHESGLVSWYDLGHHHIYEGSYQRALSSHQAIMSIQSSRPPDTAITTRLLDIIDINIAERDPDLFIFHMSRCGSTLLTKALAQCRRNNVIGEPGVVFPAIHYLRMQNAQDEMVKRSMRSLFSALGRQRLDTHGNYIVKLSSLETFAIPILKAIYPGSKMLFVYRHPVEVIISNLKKPASFIGHRVNPWQANAFEQAAAMDDAEYLAAHIGNCMDEALRSVHEGFYVLDYADLTAENFGTILDKLCLAFRDEEQRNMQRQFEQYSKSDFKKRRFIPDGEEKRNSASEKVQKLYESRLQDRYHRLRNAPNNLFNQP